MTTILSTAVVKITKGYNQ